MEYFTPMQLIRMDLLIFWFSNRAYGIQKYWKIQVFEYPFESLGLLLIGILLVTVFSTVEVTRQNPAVGNRIELRICSTTCWASVLMLLSVCLVI